MTTAPFLKETVYSWITNGTMMVQGGYPGGVLRMQYHSTLQYPIFVVAPSDEKTVIG